jgi:plasmid stability protein
MAQIIVRNLDDTTKRNLQALAAMNGRSMEEETRMIIRDAVAARTSSGSPRKLGSWIAAQSALFGVTREDVEEMEKNIGELRRQPYVPFSFDQKE